MPLYYLGAWGQSVRSVVAAGTRAFLLKGHDQRRLEIRDKQGSFQEGASYEASLKLVQAYRLNSHARWFLVCGLPWYLQRALLSWDSSL